MKRTLMLAVALALVLAAGVALAQGVPPFMVKKVGHELGLSDDQIKKIEDLIYQADKEKIDIQNELQKGRLEMQHLMSSDKPSEAAVFAQIEKVGAIQVKMKKNRVGLMLKVRAMLTPEQWEKLEGFIGERAKEFRENRMFKRMGGEFPEPPAPPAPPSPRIARADSNPYHSNSR